ncbi:MAG: alpha/beta fold hydrolase [Dokdonella sp.]
MQSVLASSGVRRLLFRRQRTNLSRGAAEHILDCGDGVRLQGFHTAQDSLPESRGLIVLLHGWEGSADSTYILQTGASLVRAGFDVFRLNFRDHGDTHHLNAGLFHSCLIDEVVGAVAAVNRLFPDQSLGVAGFSLGGNFALRIGLRAAAANIPLQYVMAICPLISPRNGLYSLETALPLYERYFLHKWRSSLKRKQALFPTTPMFELKELGGNLRDLTRSLVLRHTGFDTLEDYLDGYSLEGAALAQMQIPATILTAADDPVIPISDFRALQLSDMIELDVAEHGGHCGFIRDFSLRSWTEDYIAARMGEHLTRD